LLLLIFPHALGFKADDAEKFARVQRRQMGKDVDAFSAAVRPRAVAPGSAEWPKNLGKYFNSGAPQEVFHSPKAHSGCATFVDSAALTPYRLALTPWKSGR
jgi:hypothetical protein